MQIESQLTVLAESPATVFSGGRLAVPATLRRLLGATEGTKLRFVADENTIRVVVKNPRLPVQDSVE